MIIRGTKHRVLRATGFLAVLCLAPLLLLLRGQAQSPAAPAAASERGGGDRHEQTDSARGMEKLKEELSQLKAELGEQRRQMSAVVNHLTFAPEVEVQPEDYAQARSRFRTRLVRNGPSPQPGSAVHPPAGVTEIEYPSGGLRLKAWVNRPADERRKHPAVLFLHGGWAFYPGAWDQAKPYRDAGFVVLTPMLRGENGQPGSFSYFYDEVDDVLAAAEHLSKQPYVDPKRVFVAGHSVGGTLTMLAAMASRRFRAAASFDGAPYRPEFVTRPGSMPFDTSDPREIQLRSPLAYAGSFKCPARIYYAEESLIFRQGSVRAAALAKRRGLDVEAAEIAGDHGSHASRALLHSIAFFQRVSPEEPAPWRGETAPLPKSLEVDLGSGVGLKLVRIEPGTFRMGSPPGEAGRRDDEARHEAAISKPYALGTHVVTQRQYRQVVGMSPSHYSAKGDGRSKVAGLNPDDFPVENVTWEDAMDFCRVVSLLPGVKDKGWVVDLPTEAEWEHACRAGTETPFHHGGSLSSEQANFNGNHPYGGAAKGPFVGRTTRVGSYPANAWGLFDMHGNVHQWCKDWYDEGYRNREGADNPRRVVRGGLYSADARECRAARRRGIEPTARGGSLGFRVVVRLRER